MQPPMEQPIQPPMQPPMKPQHHMYPPTYPGMKPPMYPPRMHHPMRPMPQPPMGGYYGMGRKNILPKRPIVQINIGMGRPQPFVPVPPIGFMTHGPRHLHMPGRGYKNPVGEIIDFVNGPVGYMVEKKLGT